ncbi:MAG: NUDIX domain-containing protein [Bacilli bacterium]|nr:NUDIX domain-containing protein [Bacilli bacterium]
MRELFVIDLKNYNPNGIKLVRPSSRSIIIKDNKIYMVHSLKYDYYKFPGGGIDKGESNIDALIRETKEEAGLIVIPESIKEYGLVRRIQKGVRFDCDLFIQDNYYYFCDVVDGVFEQNLDAYEAEEHFTLEYVDYKVALEANRKPEHGPKDPTMIEREARVLELLVKEGYLK